MIDTDQHQTIAYRLNSQNRYELIVHAGPVPLQLHAGCLIEIDLTAGF